MVPPTPLLAALAALAVTAPLVAAAPGPGAVAAEPGPDLVRNGSFEDPASPRPGLVGTFRSIPGWTETTGRGVEVQNGLHPAADGGGAQYVELDSAGPSSIYQDVPTEAGALYRLSFRFTGHPKTRPAQNQFDVTFGTTTMAVSPPAVRTATWELAVVEVTAEAPVTRLTFTDATRLNDHRGVGPFIDLVEVRRIG